jgi:hypothetical protein
MIKIPIEKYYNNIKINFIAEIKKVNYKYFQDRLSKINKLDLLHFNLVEFYNNVDHLNENLEQYILNIKIKYDIPLRFISLIIISINMEFNLLILLFIIFYIIVKKLNDNKIFHEKKLMVNYFHYENIVRNYIINSKNYLINNEINSNYLLDNINNFLGVNNNIEELNNKLEFQINIYLFIFIMIVL